MEERLLFRLLTPQGERCRIPCDAVELTAKDDASGRGGGSLGVRRGHLPAVAALEEGGRVRVLREGETVFTARLRGGFARVDRQQVTVLTPAVIQ
jgi:F0F1-type ATP synthase epsilon subunit